MTASYTYESQELKVTYSSPKFDWQPVSFFISYDLSEQMEGVEEFPLLSNNRALEFLIDLKEFDWHCLDGNFTFEINFICDTDDKAKTAKYSTSVSRINLIL